MKWTRTILVSALMLVAAVANAQTVVHEGQPVYRFWQGQAIGGIGPDSLGHVGYIDSNRNFHITDGARDRDVFFKWVNASQHDTMSVGVGDSTSWLPTNNCGNLTLHFAVNGWTAGAAAEPFAKYAVSVRGSWTATNGDSVTCGKWYPNRIVGAAANGVDSLTVGSTVVGTAVAPHGDEFVVVVRYDAAAAAVASSTGLRYPEPATIIVPLASVSSYQWWFPYTQVRYRLIAASSTGLNTKLTVIGSPLR